MARFSKSINISISITICFHVDAADIKGDQQKFSELNKSGFPRPQHEKDKQFSDYSEGIGQSVEAINRKYQASMKKQVRINFHLL